jgi:hypothetical protein
VSAVNLVYIYLDMAFRLSKKDLEDKVENLAREVGTVTGESKVPTSK